MICESGAAPWGRSGTRAAGATVAPAPPRSVASARPEPLRDPPCTYPRTARRLSAEPDASPVAAALGRPRTLFVPHPCGDGFAFNFSSSLLLPPPSLPPSLPPSTTHPPWSLRQNFSIHSAPPTPRPSKPWSTRFAEPVNGITRTRRP